MTTLPSEPDRLLPLAGCVNFRDLGGYPTADGRTTRWRRLFRSDGLSRLGEEDRALLAELGLATVIDLRTVIETESRGSFPDGLGGARYHHLPLTDVLPGSEDSAHWEDPAFVSDRYLGMLAAGGGTVATVVELLAGVGGLPAVYHCSIGKDRTGILSAVILGFLGVPDELIVADYALSRPGMVRFLETLRLDYPDNPDVLAHYEPVILSVDPESMVGFLAGVRGAHGSFEGLAADLGLTGAVEVLRGELSA